MSQTPKKDFVFRKHMSIGEVDAENDTRFLKDCFVDTGDFDVLEDTNSSQCIVLGRTGSGKSALLERLEECGEQVIRIEPEELALKHISNSTILSFFEEIGVNLDIFYSLLWQHTFAVELIKHKYNIDGPSTKSNFFDSISSLISGNRKKQQALKYIEDWGDKFWLDTETRIKEFTDKLESSLTSSAGINIPNIKFSATGKAQLSEEQISEVVHYGKQVVNNVQIEKLAKIVNLLAEDIFTDPQRKTYILIDRLDENWVEDELRYKLIRALIETVRKFRKIETVKIIVTLRTDLLDRVLEKTRDSGFQREKYNSLFLPLSWTKEQLESLLDARINALLKNQYTKSDVSFTDIFPNKIDKVTSSDYILERTLLRPRDAIVFVNSCFSESQGKTEITNAIIHIAEKHYSSGRKESLEYEWFVEHPFLGKYIDILSQKSARFKVNELTKEVLEPLILELVDTPKENEDLIVKLANDYYNSDYPESLTHLSKLTQNLLYTLYKVGVVGIKVDGTSSVTWVHDKTQDLTPARVKNTSIVYIHKMLWRALAIDKRT
ncbi:P-loop ATPase, Sll1717 family [Vibrio splendidus]|uniref:P-loop ATPase, Sll1717 family n=1 Tax=Vibrio splendidus TaxID=29497 RepID=UPI000C84450D|nr:DNA repair ATPase [Vibrio splendidus]PMJ95126.1 DNA repair ATPase [Vibrio splendidus]PTP75068.1 DNA repair ATPase [Vibrio splendidus]